MKSTLDNVVVVVAVVISLVASLNCQGRRPQDRMVHYLHRLAADTGYTITDRVIGDNEWHAKAIWDADNYNITGWSILEIETNPNATNTEQAFAAGFLEGYLSKDLIDLHLINTVGDFCSNEIDDKNICGKLTAFLVANFNWMLQEIKANRDDPYWQQVNYSLYQLQGLYMGYTKNFKATAMNSVDQYPDLIAHKSNPFMKLLYLQLNGDLGELIATLTNTADPFFAGSCSAIIKVSPNNSDIYVSHATWGPYEVMLKIAKHYTFFFNHDADKTLVSATQITFSSYPGILLSIDDFYITNQNLTIIETTIGNGNASLWSFVTPQTNLYWIRVLTANRLARTGPQWAQLFSMYNSGTYNNQWMIVDYNKFKPYEPLVDELLIVLEQIPGYVIWSDQTDVLRNTSYWPSYNLPSNEFVYNITGCYESFLKWGNWFAYDKSPRALMFRRDQSKVVDIDSMIRLMRYNNYTLDELARCDCDPPYSGENTIAARSDLNPSNGRYPFDALGHRDHGATDLKMTNWKMVQNMEFIGISGPTYGDPNVPAFQWSQSDFGNSTNHYGHPDKWEYEPFHVQWTFLNKA